MTDDYEVKALIAVVLQSFRDPWGRPVLVHREGFTESDAAQMAARLIVAIRAGNIPRLRIVPAVGPDPRDQWYPGNDGVATVEELWAYYCERGDGIVQLRAELEQARCDRNAAGAKARTESAREIKELRRLVAYAHGRGTLYTDDGELQDNNCRPFIDWKRDSIDDILGKIYERNVAGLNVADQEAARQGEVMRLQKLAKDCERTVPLVGGGNTTLPIERQAEPMQTGDPPNA